MNAGELVISLLLDSSKYDGAVGNAQQGMDGLSASAEAANHSMSDFQGASSALDGVADAAHGAKDGLEGIGGAAAGVAGVADAAKGAASGVKGVTAEAQTLANEFKAIGAQERNIEKLTAEWKRMREQLVKVGAATHEIEKLDAAAKKLGVDTSSVEKKFGGVYGTLLKVAGVLGGIAAFKGAMSTYLSEADALGKYSDALGVNIVEVQAWQEAVMHAGGDGEAFKQTLSGLTAGLQQAASLGTGRMLPFLEQLGISVKDATGKAKTAMDILPELAEKFESMSKDESMGFGQKLGLDHGTIMLLQSGKKATLEAIAAGREFAAYNKKDAEAAAAVNDAIQDMQAAFKGIVTMCMRWVAPAFKTIADGFMKVAMFVRKHEPLILAMFVALGAVIMKTAVPAMISLATSTAAALAPYLAIAAAIAAVSLALEDLWVFVNGGESAFEDLLNAMGVSKDGIESVRAALKSVWDTLGLVWDLMKAVFSLDAEAMGQAWDALCEKISSIGDAIGEAFAGMWESMCEVLKSMATSVKDFFADMWDSVLGKIDNVWKAIAKFFANIKAVLVDLLPSWVKNLIGAGGDEERSTSAGKGKESGKEASPAPVVSTDGKQEQPAQIIIKEGEQDAPPATPTSGTQIIPAAMPKGGDKEAKPVPDNSIAQFQASLAGFANMEPKVVEVPQAVDNSKTTNATTNFNGPITVQTQATDANGMARDFQGAIRKQTNMLNANTGVRQ